MGNKPPTAASSGSGGGGGGRAGHPVPVGAAVGAAVGASAGVAAGLAAGAGAAGTLAGAAAGTAAGALAGAAAGTAAGALAGAAVGVVTAGAAAGGVAVAAVAVAAAAAAVPVAVPAVVIGVTLAAGRRTVCDGKSISKVSELRVVLLGSSWSERSSVGNFILAECLHFNQFKSEEEPDCIKQKGWLKEKEVVLINTPDLLLSWRSNHSLCEACRCLSAPGPHVFLLVVQPEDFTEEHKEKLCSFLKLYSDRSFDHSLVLLSTPREQSSAFMRRCLQHPPLKEMIEKCKSRFLWREKLELAELLTRLEEVVEENNGEHV